MVKSARRAARKSLDREFARIRPVVADLRPPHRGWVRAIRDALGMSQRELAERLGVHESRIGPIEQGEMSGAIKLDTLERAARALNCRLVYALVPNEPLETMVRDQALRKAHGYLDPARHTMRLEDQEVTGADESDLESDLVDELIDRRGLWDDIDP